MPEESVRLFISYSHRDETLRQQLDKHLAPLKGQKIVEAWHDRQIQAGDEWAGQIDENLNNADIILLLISPDFVASNYCYNIELAQAMKRHENGEAIVVPVILEPCDWSWLPFAKLQAFPKDGKAVTIWSNQNEAFLDVVMGIRRQAQSLFEQRRQQAAQEKEAKARFLQKLEGALADQVISDIERDTLDELREELGLTPEAAAELERQASASYRKNEKARDNYRKTLTKLLEKGAYPFSEEIRKELTLRQQDLGLKDEDVRRIEQPILAEAEAKYQEKLQAAAGQQRPSAAATETPRPLERQGQQAELQRTLQHSDEGKIDAAFADYNKAIELDPHNASAYNNRGNAYYAKGEYDKAIADYTKAIKLDPAYAVVYNNRGTAYYNKGEYDKAIADCDKAIKLAPGHADTCNCRGNAYYAKGEYDKAIADYTKAIKLDPAYAIAYDNRGSAYYNKGKRDRAIADYNKAIELDPNYADAYSNRGNAYYDVGDWDKAIADYDKAIELDPDYAIVYNYRGNLYFHDGDSDRAIADYDKAIELDPDYGVTYGNRANAYYAKGEYDKAIADYDKAIELDPNDADAYAGRANVYSEKEKAKS